MTQSLLSKIEGLAGPKNTELNVLLDKQQNGFVIETMVDELGMTYLEATTAFMEENSIEAPQFNKYIPSAIIEKITSEAIDDNQLRPSVAKLQKTNTLDFLL